MNDLYLKPINKNVAKEMIIKNHYSHRWTMCNTALGIFKRGIENKFFENISDDELLGTIVYGNPVGRHVIKSISSELKSGQVFELTRLWIKDGTPKNTESWFIAQSFDWLRKNKPNIKVLISYADPGAGHKGTIYQATNWLYQYIDSTGDGLDYQYSLIEPSEQTKWLHPRTIGARLGGSRDPKYVEEKLQRPFWKKSMKRRKFRYLYILANKKEKREILRTLKHPIQPYPKTIDNIDTTITKYEFLH